MRSFRFTAAAAAWLFVFAPAGPAHTQEDAVVVTASRAEQQVREVIPHTTVIGAREIRESGAADLLSLLRREAGFEFSQNGGIGTVSGTFLRGASANQVLVLVDGVRISNLNFGSTRLDQLMLDQIERVEIVRGNVSSLYGSGAIGGVIQVFTRRGAGVPRASVDAGLGAEGTRRLRADYSGEAGGTRFSFNVSRYHTDGFSAIDPRIAPNANPERDGYRNDSYSVSLSQRFAPGHEAGLRWLSSHGRIEFDNAFHLPADRHSAGSELESAVLYSNNQLGARWFSQLALSLGRDRYGDERNGNVTSRVRTRNSELRWQNDLVLAPDHGLMLGADLLRQEISSTTTSYTRTGRDVEAFLAGYRGRFGRHALQFNLRLEDYSDFGRANTHFAGYGYELSDRWRLTASASRAFRAPTFNELFFPGFGNPSLRPERARSLEAGLQYAAGAHLARLVAFRSRITDLIGGFPIVNVNRAEIDGVELSYRGALAGFDLRASFTVQDPEQIDAAGVRSQLVRRARSFGSLSAGRAIGPWRLAAEVLASSQRFDNHITAFPAQRVPLSGYEVVNLVADYRLGADTVLQGRLDNAFDAGYQLAHGYNTQGRKLTVQLRHRF